MSFRSKADSRTTSTRRASSRPALPVAVLAFVAATVAVVVPTPRSAAASDGFAALERPARLVDTRAGATTVDGSQQGDGLRSAGSVTEVVVAGRAGLGAEPDVVVLNLTVTGPQSPGYLTVWPCGSDRPVASNLNFAVGQTIANQAMARIGTGGRVCVFTSAPTHLIVDAAGTFTGAGAPTMLDTPTRLLDTRTTTIAGGGTTVAVDVRGRSGIGSDARVAVLNVTVTRPQTAGFVTVFPCGAERPNASNLNFTAGATVANAAIAGIGANGQVCVYVSATTHLVVDVAGTASSPDMFRMLDAPARLLDTRNGSTTIDGRRAGGGIPGVGGAVALEVAGRAGVPGTAAAVLLNVTVTGARGNGFVTAHACGTERPNASNLNYAAGQTIAGSVIARVGVDGKVRLFTSQSAHLVVDVAGWLDVSGGAATGGGAACADDPGRLADSGRGLGTTATVRVTKREGGAVWFEITDTSRRNFTAGTALPSPTLDRRVIYVKAFYPSLADGRPDPASVSRVSITGHYRNGTNPVGCDFPIGGNNVKACVAFPLMDPNELPVMIGWRDISNHAVDISLVLDAITTDPTLVGRVSPASISYSGGSMAGISGMFLLHPQSRDTRFAAIMSGVGFAPPWVPEFSDPATWASGPKVLMENTLDDPVITYELARLTYQNAKSPNLTLITYSSGQHSIPATCPAAYEYKRQWIAHVLDGGPAPAASLLAGSTCAALGVQPGGTTGWGSAEAFRPR